MFLSYTRRIVWYLIGLSYSLTLLGQTNSDLLKVEIGKIIQYDTPIDLSKNKGFLIGIIDHDSTFIIEFDSPDLTHDPLSSEALFHIGGLTKVFTAALLCELESRNEIDLSSPINAFLPKSFHNVSRGVTLSQLMTHSSGLPKQPFGIGKKQPDAKAPYSLYSKDDVLHFYRQYNSWPKKPVFEYSHLNYALIEVTLEYATGQSFDSLIHRYVLDPLRLSSTSFATTRTIEPGFDRGYEQVESPSYASHAGALGLITNMNDLISFTRAQWNSEELPFDHMHQPLVKTGIKKSLYLSRPWYTFTSKRQPSIYTHAGRAGGHKSFIGFVKESKTGVIILSRSIHGTEDLGLLILRMINNNWKS